MELVLTENDQRYLPMHGDELGYWQAEVEGLKEGATYKFRLNGERELPDPASLSQPDGVHGPSQLITRFFDWTDETWKGLAQKEYIIYELHTGCFSEEGNFEGIMGKLDYLVALGITAIEIMPIGEFPGTRNWGYDIAFPFAVYRAYGGARVFKELVNAAHLKGLAVILDVVYNHLGPDGSYQTAYAPFLSAKHPTPWGKGMNFDDAYSDGVREYYLQNALMWLDEFRVDALRVDAVHAIADFGAHHFMKELKIRVDALQQRTGREKLIIAELDLNDPRYIAPFEEGGFALHAQWNDELHHALHVSLTGERFGYYEDFIGLPDLTKSLTHSYVYTGGYSVVRKRNFGADPSRFDHERFVVFSQNHDQIGNRMFGERLISIAGHYKARLAAAVILLSPGIPLLFMGEESAAETPFYFFTDHTDPVIGEKVIEGRMAEFGFEGSPGDFPVPQSEETFQRSKLDWKGIQDPQRAEMLDWYKALIRLRRTHPVMQNARRDALRVMETDDPHLLHLVRTNGEGHLHFLFNFLDQPVSHPLLADEGYSRLLSSTNAQQLPPYGVAVLEPIQTNASHAIPNRNVPVSAQ